VADKSYNVKFAELNEAQTRAVSGALADEGIKVGVAALGEGSKDPSSRQAAAYIADLDKQIAHVQAGAVAEVQGLLEQVYGDTDFAGIDEDAGDIVSDYFTRQQEAASKGVSADQFLKQEMARTTKDRTEGLGGFSITDIVGPNAAQREAFEGVLLTKSKEESSELFKLNKYSDEKASARVAADRIEKEKIIRTE
jgi:hypothetical protein